ncbi:hypothetical protein MFRU_059g00090 [Monilinia fructicola]|nr:hypothetical protein MFRU_059g00090 [Monilinia fructicola]
MVSIRNLALVASSILSFASAAPALDKRQDAWVPGTLNNTQEFYLHMIVTDGDYTHESWVLEAWHTGAGMADPVFVDPSNSTGSRMYFNSSQLQFDVSPYPFSINALPSDTNYARWEPVTITSGYGSGKFVNEGSAGFQVDDPEADGWVVCEWYHGLNAPQLFQMIKYFDEPSPYDVPSSCARVLLFPVWI